jgi:uncharacterized membrane protein YfcA
VNFKALREPPGIYIYTLVASAIMVALVQIVLGDGIDWVMLVILVAATMIGVYIGLRVRANRSTA